MVDALTASQSTIHHRSLMNSLPVCPAPPVIRVALDTDVDEIVRVTNLAFLAEAFCVRGDRTDAIDIRNRFASGMFFVIDDPANLGVGSRLLASVYCAIINGRGYLGLISVDATAQGLGLSRLLVVAVEQRCRDAGCSFIDITVVNVREALFAFYAKFGFVACDVLPFPLPERALQPLLLVKMTKPLRSPVQLALPAAR